jgi:hypothetical protein
MRNQACEDAINTLMKWRDGELDLPDVPEISSPVGRPEFTMPVKFISKPEADPIVIGGDTNENA